MRSFTTLLLRVLPLLLPFGGAVVLTGCQSPHGAAEAGGRLKSKLAANAGSRAWRANYRKATEKFANTPAWNPPAGIPDGDLANARTSYSRVRISQKYVAMTFDDGPHPTNTPRLLDLMKKRNVKATFFVVGRNAKAYPHILRRMIAEGHEVANHTWNHPDLTKLSLARVRDEFDSTRDAIVAAVGVKPRLSRPPYGAVNSTIKDLLKNEYGYPTILWSVDPMDWKRPGSSVVTRRLVSGTHPGAILLAHDIHRPTIDAMPATFDQLLAKGYKFVTVSQLIRIEQTGQAAQVAPPVGPGTPSHPDLVALTESSAPD